MAGGRRVWDNSGEPRRGLTIGLPLAGLVLSMAFGVAAVPAGESSTSAGAGPDAVESAVPVTTLTVHELWRLRDGADDLVLGAISEIVSDGDGTAYLLDSRLCEVLVIGPTGRLVARLGGEGDGPGEFRRPVDLFLEGHGEVGVVQVSPGGIARLSGSGDLLGSHPLPFEEFGDFLTVAAAERASDGLVVVLNSRERLDDGSVDFLDTLLRLDGNGAITARYYERRFNRPFEYRHFRERDQDGSMPEVWDVGADGRVYVSERFDSYRIGVYSPGGEPEQVLTRAFEPYSRPRALVDRYREYAESRPRNRSRGTGKVTYEASTTERDIQKIFARDDGSVWVLSSQGAFAPGNGMLAVLDVFDRRGRYVKRIAVPGHGDYHVDGLFIANNRLFHVRNMLAAVVPPGGDVLFETGKPHDGDLEVICYRF